MIRIFDIALKDLLQLVREFQTFMFLILMPIAFTVLFGFAFGGFDAGPSDSRLPVGYLDQDDSRLSRALRDLLAGSEVIRLDEDTSRSPAGLEQLVAGDKLAAAILVPRDYGRGVRAGRTTRLIVYADTGSSAWTTIEAELVALAGRLDGAARTASILDNIDSESLPFDFGFDQTLERWDDPPIGVIETTSLVIHKAGGNVMSLAHTAPGMMLQFAIAGLLTAAQVIVTERRSRTLQRMLTTATNKAHIVLGHYLAIVILILGQFTLLITFGQFILGVDYLRVPLATLLVAFSAALCIAAMGLLIGLVAQTEQQAVIFSLIPMFVFSGLGGAWVPLDVTGAAFRAIGHVSPIAWAMDGFENIAARGLGFGTVLVPCAALAGYAILFFTLAVWRLNASEEK